ncbi:heme-binding protein [Rhizobium sp. CNPSo 4039]|uniref:GlcG/HbpS family heme-binding protein n=1 Tax=Rhizobium sp. CNPSo 4039 TaxID=3021409 RepID=UPI00254FF234|nr:heme-binding protein [Rhizobium sp. CNPSo 4039]MDK4717309.1 heme-binding protein [Rhizobium sp. CNPSo 4039]
MARFIELAAARDMIAAAEARAAEIGVRASIVVLDHGGDLVAMARMDGAWAGAFDLAMGKARTSRAFEAPSSAFVPLIQPGQPLFSVSSVGSGQYVILPGGVPLLLDGRLAGAVGVSGGTPDHDADIAEAAASAIRT